MPAAVNAGDWLAEIDQVYRSHAVSALVHLNAQPEPNDDNFVSLDICQAIASLCTD